MSHMGSPGKVCPQLNAQQRDLVQVRRRKKTHWNWIAGLGDLLVQLELELELIKGAEVAANPAQQRGAHPHLLCSQAERWSQQLLPHWTPLVSLMPWTPLVSLMPWIPLVSPALLALSRPCAGQCPCGVTHLPARVCCQFLIAVNPSLNTLLTRADNLVSCPQAHLSSAVPVGLQGCCSLPVLHSEPAAQLLHPPCPGQAGDV